MQLESWAHRSRSAPQLARRARLVLACAVGRDNKTVAKRLRLSPATVGKWRARFVRDRVDGLLDEPRPGAPRTVTDAQVERVVMETLETTPRGATHWSTRSLARATGLSRMTISRIWHAFGLRPHRSETFKLSPDPLLIEKVRGRRRVVYQSGRSCVVLCVDEKSQIQALDRSAPLLPMQPGQAEPAPTITHGTGRRRCLRRSMCRLARSSARRTAAIGRWSSASSSIVSTRGCRRTSTYISSWTTRHT